MTATRWYSFAGQTVAVRTGVGMGAVASIVADANGTPMASIQNTNWTAAVTRIRTDPFGAARTGQAGTVSGHGFLGAPSDATGFTLLGARYYDPTTGTFISPDPELDSGVPAQFNAYVYSGNNPITWSDPTGLNWWGDMWGHVSRFVNRHKAEITGFVVGVAVTAGCLAITAGAGSVGCAVAGGMAGAAVTNVMHQAESKKPFSIASFATDVVIGGAVGGLLGPAGKLVGKFVAPIAKRAVGALVNAAKPMVNGLSKAVSSGASRVFGGESRAVVSNAAGGAEKAASCAVNSFVPGTLVAMANGTRQAIENIKLGDKVLATDPHTGKRTAEPVIRTITGHGPKDLVSVTTTDAHGVSGTMVATAGHPFWLPQTAEWVDAGHLQPGMWLQTTSGTWVLVSAVAHDHREQTVHNLTIDTVHTFSVYAGDHALLTHNCGDVAKTYQTYTKVHPDTGEVYVGRTSGRGTPQENVAARDSGHGRNSDGFGPATLDQTGSYEAIRGREQQLIEYFRGMGIAAKQINGFSPFNKNLQTYLSAANREFG